MSRRPAEKKGSKRGPGSSRKPQPGLLGEAWENFTRDFSRVLPPSLAEKLQSRPGRWKWALALAALELLVLGFAVKLIWNWLQG